MSNENEDSVESFSNPVDNDDGHDSNKYYEIILEWIPSNLNPDLVLIFSIFGIIIDIAMIMKTITQFTKIGEGISFDILIDWVDVNFKELIVIILLFIILLLLLIYSNIAIERIIGENTKLKVLSLNLLRWVPDNLNPDVVLVVGVLWTVLDTGIITSILQNLDMNNEDKSIVDQIAAHTQELLLIFLLLVGLLLVMNYIYIATQRVLEENTKLKIPLEELFNFANEPRVTKFAFQFFMIATGTWILTILANRGFPLQDTLFFMFAWFVLMLLIPTPKGAKTDVNPFGEDPPLDHYDSNRSTKSPEGPIPESLQQCQNCNEFQTLLISQCVNCGALLESCQVCKRGFKRTETKINCPHCETIFHPAHLMEAIKISRKCPICKTNLSEADFQMDSSTALI